MVVPEQINTQINTWLSIIALGLSIVSLIGQLIRRSGAKTEVHEKKLIEHDRRIQTVEADMKHVPTKSEAQDLRIAVTRLQGQVEHLDHTMGTLAHTVRRIDDFLRESK